MAIVVPNEGELVLLARMLAETSISDTYSLKLYQSVTGSLGASTVVADFTEATFTGYAARSLTRANWNSSPVIGTVSGKAEATYTAEQAWTAGSSQTVNGYYVTTGDGTKTLWAEAFSSAIALTSNDILRIRPKLTLNSE